MSKRISSELVEISRLNGSFRRNYGTLLGAYLYLRSISAARGGPFMRVSIFVLVGSIVVAWLKQRGLAWPISG
jgi:hypothetical protein